jgi:HlyD family secretion protein
VIRKTVLAGLAVLGILAVTLGSFWPFPFGERAGSLRLPGVVEIQEVRLGSKVGGRVAEVSVAEGDLVAPGQPLVRFDVPELEDRRAQAWALLRAAEAALEKANNGPRPQEIEAARAALAAAEARLARLRAGAREQEIRGARDELAGAEADAALARAEFDRVEPLYRRGINARSDYDAALAASDRARAHAAAARAHLELLEAGARPEEIAEAEADAQKVRADLALLEAGTRPEDKAAAEAAVAEARARLEELEAGLAEAVVRAPGKAVVEVLAVRPGDLVAPNTPVVRVLRAEDLWVKVYVPETELGKVRLNQPVEVFIDSYPGRRFAGVVAQVAGASEFTPRNVQSLDERRHQVFGVKVVVPNPQGVFKSGMAADVVLPLRGTPR